MAWPSDLTTVIVEGRYENFDSTPASGRVIFTPTASVVDTANKIRLLPTTFVAILDSTGSFAVEMPATDDTDVTPSGFTYIVSEQLNGYTPAQYNIQVPASTPIAGDGKRHLSLITIAPSAPLPNVSPYVLLAQVGTPNGVASLDTAGLVPLAQMASGTPAAGKYVDGGTRAWTVLPTGGGGVTDGDKGDITVSASGTVWTIDNGTITPAKQSTIAANSIVGNNTGSAAAPAALTMAQVLAALSGTAGADFSLNSHKITNLTNGSAAQDAATVSQLPVVQDEGSSLTYRNLLNFAGAGVTATDTGTSVLVTIPGGGGTTAAASITMDASTSNPQHPAPTHNLQDFADWVSRQLWDVPDLLDRDVIKVAAYNTYALAGAAPGVGADGVPIPGLAPLDANRRVPAANLGSGTADGTTVLYGDGVYRVPTATAVRDNSWSPGDNNLKGVPGGQPPSIYSGANTNLGTSVAYVMKMYLMGGVAVTNYIWWVQAGGTGTLADYYFALFNADATGTLVGSSATADVQAKWTSSGIQTQALPSPFTPSSSGFYYLMCRTGTASTAVPKITIAANHLLMNIGLTTGSNVAPNSSVAPIWGQATNDFTGTSGSKTAPSTTGNIIESGATVPFFVGLS